MYINYSLEENCRSFTTARKIFTLTFTFTLLLRKCNFYFPFLISHFLKQNLNSVLVCRQISNVNYFILKEKNLSVDLYQMCQTDIATEL